MTTTQNKDNPKDNPSSGKLAKSKLHATPPSGVIADFMTYLKGVKTEWTKVSWPTWPQIWQQTVVVVVMVTIVSIGIFLIDRIFHWIISVLVPGKL